MPKKTKKDCKTIQDIPLDQLFSDPRNANVCDSETLNTLRLNIERTGSYPSLIVRPHPGEKDAYVIIDGHHRKDVLEELGYTTASCEVWKVNDKEAALLLATLNRLRGEDHPRKRAELLEMLCRSFDEEELLALIPESDRELQDLLALLNFEEKQLQKEIDKVLSAMEENLPVILNFMLPASDAEFVEETLKQFQPVGEKDPSAGLIALCKRADEKEVMPDG